MCIAALLWTRATNPQGNEMAGDEEPIITNPPTQDVAIHVRDYMRFTKLLKWGALGSLVIAFIVLLIL